MVEGQSNIQVEAKGNFVVTGLSQCGMKDYICQTTFDSLGEVFLHFTQAQYTFFTFAVCHVYTVES